MAYGDCRDNVRFTLSDDSGQLRFESFEIVDTSECQLTGVLQEYLVGRPLAKVDLDYLRSWRCTANGECLQAVIRMVCEYQAMFSPERSTGSALC